MTEALLASLPDWSAPTVMAQRCIWFKAAVLNVPWALFRFDVDTPLWAHRKTTRTLPDRNAVRLVSSACAVHRKAGMS